MARKKRREKNGPNNVLKCNLRSARHTSKRTDSNNMATPNSDAHQLTVTSRKDVLKRILAETHEIHDINRRLDTTILGMRKVYSERSDTRNQYSADLESSYALYNAKRQRITTKMDEAESFFEVLKHSTALEVARTGVKQRFLEQRHELESQFDTARESSKVVYEEKMKDYSARVEDYTTTLSEVGDWLTENKKKVTA